jgi:uncharacterized protein
MRALRRLDLKRSQTILARVKKWAKKIASDKRVLKILLFGSFAQGQHSEASDVDILIVGNFTERFLDRGNKFLIKTDLPIELFCYTPLEIQSMKKENNVFIQNALEKSTRLYSA